ncbi:hypothetical protein IFM89_019645 [Coptis chinensis]|uniref:Uncharacterized protein n=1 Tax=Coptis chinensis TaxID=261450 RepID=A0A835I1L4_9MAGN|nr:hypothetical protein IFM89_019645 [Coptis chinensis]
MAEAIVSVVIDQLASVIGKELEQEVRLVVGVRKEVKKLETNLTLIKAVLEDAEKKEIHENAVKIWLEDLKDVIFRSLGAIETISQWWWRGSKIIVTTTRNEGDFAAMIGSIYIHRLAQLSDDDCWHIFKQIAFCGRTQQEQERLKGIGQEIAKKCKGVPLAVKTLASLMRFKRAKEDWTDVLKSDVWETQEKDHNMEKDKLVKLWMAQGYLARWSKRAREALKELPETVRSLVNLQTLKLNRCGFLCKLPEGIGELSNLRHLEVENTPNLIYYPRGGIERLSHRTLSKFVVSDGSSKGSVIGELGNLNFLKGSLSIRGLRHVKSGNEAKLAELQKKEKISSLELHFGYKENGQDIGHVSREEEIRRMEGVLENLEPHKESLERLEIQNYVGSTLPTWMRMMSNITYLKLLFCSFLDFKPEELKPLTMLRKLYILLAICCDFSRIWFRSSESKQEMVVVPPNSRLYYEVELESFVKERESWDMSTPEKIEAAGKKKKEGNVAFKAGKYAKASKRYEKAGKFIEYDTNFSDEEKK